MIAPELAIKIMIGLPFVAMVAIWLLDKAPNLREGVTLLTAAALTACALVVFLAVGNGARPEVTLFEVIADVPLKFAVEPLGALFGLIASGLWLVNSLYSIGYMRGHHEKNQTRFYMAFAVAIASAIGVAYSANLFTLFIFYELLTVSTYPLVAHAGDEAAKRGARVYLGVLMGSSIGLFLVAIVWTWVLAGSTDFTPGGLLAQNPDAVAGITLPLLLLYAYGVGKAALMPMHSWLPNAMVAPTPVSAFLHAVAVVKAGVFCILKIVVYIFGIDLVASSGAGTPLVWIASASILCASFIAMNKDNLKARLAYSTVSQLSYITLGAMLASDMGVIGGGMQIAMHALGKMTLFMCAGAIMVAAHKTKVSEFDGLGRKMPFTFGAFLIGALSIIGLPPLAGSWPKFFLMLGAADAGHVFVIFVLALSSVLNILYLLPIPFRGFFLPAPGTPQDAPEAKGIAWGNLREAPLLCVLPPMLTAAGCFALFFYGGALYQYLLPILEVQ